MPDAPATTPVDCPRCGYDLTGVVAAWTDTCPLNGACSECGLEIEWANVLREDRRRVSWLYEHAAHFWNMASAVSTMLRVLAPGAFWRAIQPHHRVRIGRIALLLCGPLVLGVILWLGVVLSYSLSASAVWNRPLAVSRAESLQSLLAPIDVGRRSRGYRAGYLVDAATTSVVLFNLAFAVSLLVMQSAWKSHNLRPALACRAILYAFVPLTLLVAFQLAFHATAEAVQLVEIYRQSHGISALVILNSSLNGMDRVEPFILGASRRPVVMALTAWGAIYWTYALARGLRLRTPVQVLATGLVLGLLAQTAVIKMYPHVS